MLNASSRDSDALAVTQEKQLSAQPAKKRQPQERQHSAACEAGRGTTAVPRPVNKVPAGGSAARRRGTRRDPGPSASGEGHTDVREGSKPRAETLRRSVYESPVRRLPHAQQLSQYILCSWGQDLFPSHGLCIVNSDPKHGKTLLQLFGTRLGSVSGRKLGLQPTIHFERVT